ncbi:MAG TPA: 50S ribosomal protein L2 [Candidatus Paceibacterota bacterium]|nr:50S ribosomal protein L2 [Candidatus Paceibacterota bacterium]
MKKYKPTSPSRRGMTTLPYKELLSGDKPMKSLLSSKKRQAGRNNAGRITTRHQGGGHKRRFRDVDFSYNKKDIPARVETVEYDPYRTAFISRVVYADGERRYVLAPKDGKVGDTFIVGENAPVKPGNRLPIGKIPSGTFIYNIELKVGAGARLARSAGNYAEIVAHDAGYAQIKLPSSEIRRVSDLCYASVGAVGNENSRLVNIGKAGRSRWLGIRPTVRGTAMNPVDHPHGGGEGKQGRGLRRAKSMWGKPTGKGQKTRTPKKYSNVFIVSRRKVGKKR